MIAVDRDPAFEAECAAYLTERGYKVTKTRARTAARLSAVGYDVRSCVHCGGAATRTTMVGARKLKDRLEVGICEDCYRFGPGLHATPFVAADPARAAKLYRAWRHAQRRYHATITHDYRGAYNAHPRLIALTKALQAAPMVRRETLERSIAA